MSIFKFAGVLIFTLVAVETYAADQSICSPGSQVEVYPNGLLKSCILKDYYNSNNIKCNKGQMISFYADAKVDTLDTCILAEPATINGQKCKQSEPVSFYSDGKFKSCVKLSD